MKNVHDTPVEEIGAVPHPPSLFAPFTGAGNLFLIKYKINIIIEIERFFLVVTRQDFPSAPERAFLLHGILSPEECDFYVKSTETVGYKSLEKVIRSFY